MSIKSDKVRESDENVTQKITSMIRHELANTVAGIPNLIEMLKYLLKQKQISSPEIENILESLTEISESSKKLLLDEFQFTQVELSEKDRISPLTVNLVIQDALKNFANTSLNRKLFEVILAPNLPEVRANKKILILAINNLIRNSIDALQLKEKNDTQIKIKTHMVQDFVAIDIIDKGIGISKDIQERVFKVGFTTKKNSGGLGLWLTSHTIRQFGGNLELISSGKNGTTFRILLNKWTSPINPLGKRRVLIVDDHRISLNFIETVLNDKEYEINSATNAAEAIKLVQKLAFDIALLDIKLPDLEFTGIDIARIVREYNPEAVIILISGYSDVNMLKAALDVGVDAFLPKEKITSENIITTINSELLKKINEVSQRRETRRESVRQEQQDKFIYETLSIFSHELRSPLVTAHWHVEALISGALGKMTKKQLDAVKSVHFAIRREFTLLDTHLDLSRIERGLEVLNFKSFNLVKVMREEILAYEDAAKRKKIQIKTILPEETAIVKIDINRFRAALNPLMDNAIKFSSENSEIAISMKLEPKYVEVTISDQGPGIKTEELNRLNSSEGSLDVRLSQRIRASGLGLSLAKRIIENYHDGKMWFVKQRKGEKGTTVAFRLPIQT